MTRNEALVNEDIACAFHEAYERLAPGFGYKTREASAVAWSEVPEANRKLMIAVADEVRAALSSPYGDREVLAEGWLFDVVRDRKGAIVGGRLGAVVPSYRLGPDTPQAVIILPAEPTRQ